MAIDGEALLRTTGTVEQAQPSDHVPRGLEGLTGYYYMGDCVLQLRGGLVVSLNQRVNGKWVDITEQRRIKGVGS